MTAIFLMLKTFFGGLIPGGAGAVASIVTNPLGTIKKILTLLIVVIIVGTLGYFAVIKIKQTYNDRNKIETGLATTATNNAKSAEVAQQSGVIDTNTVAQAAEEKQKITDASNSIDKEHASRCCASLHTRHSLAASGEDISEEGKAQHRLLAIWQYTGSSGKQ